MTGDRLGLLGADLGLTGVVFCFLVLFALITNGFVTLGNSSLASSTIRSLNDVTRLLLPPLYKE